MPPTYKQSLISSLTIWEHWIHSPWVEVQISLKAIYFFQNEEIFIQLDELDKFTHA